MVHKTRFAIALVWTLVFAYAQTIGSDFVWYQFSTGPNSISSLGWPFGYWWSKNGQIEMSPVSIVGNVVYFAAVGFGLAANLPTSLSWRYCLTDVFKCQLFVAFFLISYLAGWKGYAPLWLYLVANVGETCLAYSLAVYVARRMYAVFLVRFQMALCGK